MEAREYFGKLFGVGHVSVGYARALLREDALGAARVKATPPAQEHPPRGGPCLLRGN